MASSTLYIQQAETSTANVFPAIRRPFKVRVLLIVLLVLTVLAAVFIVLYAKEKADSASKQNQSDMKTTRAPTHGQKQCTSPACVISAGDILQNLDTSVDPCADFYQYGCGGFVKNRHIPEDQSSLTTFGIAQDFVDYSAKALMEDEQLMLNASKEPNSAIHKAFIYYESCMNVSQIESAKIRPMTDAIDKYMRNGATSIDSFIMEKVLARVSVHLGTNAFISWDVMPSYFNKSEIIITVAGGSSGLDRGLDQKKLFALTKQKGIGTGYQTFVTTVFEQLGTPPGRILDQYALDIFQLEVAFHEIKHSLKQIASTVGYKHALTMTLDQLNNFTSFKFNWTVYFEEVLRGTNKSLGANEKLMVLLPNDVKQIVDFIVRQKKRILLSAVMLNVYRGFINSLPERFREPEYNFNEIVTGLKTPQPRWKICVAATNAVFKYATALLFSNKYLSEDARKRAADLFSEIKEEFSDGLEEQTWMDNKTRDEARIKVNAMRQSIGYPPFIKDPIQLNKEYEKIHVSPFDFFQNKLNVLKATMLHKIDAFGKPPDPTIRFPRPPVGVNAFYDPTSNRMTVLMGMLLKPVYESDWLKALNYGAIGMVIGHEISHGFDVLGSQFVSNGNLRSWWTNKSLDNFKERLLCLAKQYNKTTVYGRMLDGEKTLSENIADNGGLKYAFRAYRKWRDANGDEDKLPALDVTNDQLFFIGFAQTWCAKYREERIDFLLSEDTHSLNPARVRVPLSNFPEFHKAFGCKAPTKTCTVW